MDGDLLHNTDKTTQKSQDKINSNPHFASGFVGGVLNGVSDDENGVRFDVSKFATGFLGGAVGSKAIATATKKLSPKIYNNILGVAKQYPTMADKNPQLLGKIYANAKSSSLNVFAGEKALNANVARLKKAKKLEQTGVDEVKIWQETGWFKDEADSAWKFEISPKGGKIIGKNDGFLKEVLKYDKLFDAYPELKYLNVSKIDTNLVKKKQKGYYDDDTKTIGLVDLTDKETLYTKIQQAIQRFEGFKPSKVETMNVVRRIAPDKKLKRDIIIKENPAMDDYHTWIRETDDIVSFKEGLENNGFIQAGKVVEGPTPDYTKEMIQKALKSGKIDVYSSYPIKVVFL